MIETPARPFVRPSVPWGSRPPVGLPSVRPSDRGAPVRPSVRPWGSRPSVRPTVGLPWGFRPSVRPTVGLPWGSRPTVGLPWGFLNKDLCLKYQKLTKNKK